MNSSLQFRSFLVQRAAQISAQIGAQIKQNLGLLRQPIRITTCLMVMIMGLLLATPAAWATLTDDHFDGNIFPLYAGNGSLVPPRVTLAEAFQRDRPTLLVFYVDDSKDCKRYVSVVSQLDAFYGRAANFIPIAADSIPPQTSYTPMEPGHYYEGFVPQTVLLDQSGKVVFNEKGAIAYEKVDDVFRKVFDLLPRSESAELKRRQINEVNTELVE